MQPAKSQVQLKEQSAINLKKKKKITLNFKGTFYQFFSTAERDGNRQGNGNVALSHGKSFCISPCEIFFHRALWKLAWEDA